MNAASGKNFLMNYTEGLVLFDQFEKDYFMRPCIEEPIGQFGISSLTPANFHQPVQQGLDPRAGAQMQPQGASVRSTMNGVAGHQQNGQMDTLVLGDHDLDFIVDDPDISSLLPPRNVTNDPESQHMGQWNRIDQGSGNPDVRCQPQGWANTLANRRGMQSVNPSGEYMHNQALQPNHQLAWISATSDNQQGMHSVNAMAQDMQNQASEPDHQQARISSTSNELLELEPKLLELEGVCQESRMHVQDLKYEVQQLHVQLPGQLHIIDKLDRTGLSQQQLQVLATLVQKRDLVIQKEKTILGKYCSSVVNLPNLLSKVLDNGVKEYQRNAAYKACGKPVSEYLTIDKLQEWVKRLAKLISSNLQQVGELSRIEQLLGLDSQPQPPNGATSTQTIKELNRNYWSMIESLVQKGLVVERHPPQVLMKGKRFQSRLRHLIGDALDINTITFRVKAYLVNDRQVEKVLEEGSTSTFGCSGEITGPDGGSDYDALTGRLSVNMRTMSLKMPQRGGMQRIGTSGTETVAQQKFAMLFRTEITVRHFARQTTVASQALSLPIVVISHGKQEADAQATILWDNAFAEINRKPFEVNNSVPWLEMLDALDAQWKVACRDDTQDGVGLNQETRKYLTTRLFNPNEVTSETMITWNKFNSDKMIMRGSADQRHPFTFWTWFYKVMELCSSRFIKKYWNQGLIHGFLSKHDCQKKLLQASRERKPGIFIFRFSETRLAAVSISCTVNKNDRIEVLHYSPDTTEEFRVRGLPDMLRDLKDLHYLYPDRLKDEVFGSYYKKPIAPRRPSPPYPYVDKEFVVAPATVVDNLGKTEPGAGPESLRSEFPVSSHDAGSPRENGYMDEDSN